MFCVFTCLDQFCVTALAQRFQHSMDRELQASALRLGLRRLLLLYDVARFESDSSRSSGFRVCGLLSRLRLCHFQLRRPVMAFKCVELSGNFDDDNKMDILKKRPRPVKSGDEVSGK